MKAQNTMNGDTVFFGFPEECKKFSERHHVFLERLPRLAEAIDIAFTRVTTMSTAEDKVIYFYGRLCAEDFMEILLLCEHGYGAAAMKLLRTMYEHGVTLRYLHEHPEEVSLFMDYHQVAQYKLMIPILESFPGALPETKVAEIESRFEKVKERFLVVVCEKCGKKRVNHTWSKLDFVSMAKKTGAIGSLIVSGYYLPLRHAHSTFAAITERLETVDGRLGFKVEAQANLADEALITAHNVILNALDVQSKRFNIPRLEDHLQLCMQDFMSVWTRGAATP